MKNYFERINLSYPELAVLEALKKLSHKSAFQLADHLSGKYDTLTIMRSLHTLLKMELLVRVNFQGEQLYSLNQRNISNIKMILQHTKMNRHDSLLSKGAVQVVM